MSSSSLFRCKSCNSNNNYHNNNHDNDSKHLKICFFSPLPHVLSYFVFATYVCGVDRVWNGWHWLFFREPESQSLSFGDSSETEAGINTGGTKPNSDALSTLCGLLTCQMLSFSLSSEISGNVRRKMNIFSKSCFLYI